MGLHNVQLAGIAADQGGRMGPFHVQLAHVAAYCILKVNVGLPCEPAWFSLVGFLPTQMQAFGHDPNASPLPMSLSWPIEPQKKSCAGTGIGSCYALSYTDEQLTLAHQIHHKLLHETAVGTYILFSWWVGFPHDMFALACDTAALTLPMTL